MAPKCVAHLIDPRARTVTEVPYALCSAASPADAVWAHGATLSEDGVPDAEYHFAKRVTGHAAVLGVYSVGKRGLGAGVERARVWARDDLEDHGAVPTTPVRHGFRLAADSACFYDTALLVRVVGDRARSRALPPLEPLWVEDAAHGGRGTFSLSVASGPSGALTTSVVDSMRVCAHCARAFEGGGVCARCKSVRYCGKECQTATWPAHKAACHRA